MGCASSKPDLMVDEEMSVKEFLSENTFFKNLSPQHISQAAAKFMVREYSAGERIISQGDKADELFLIAKGAVNFIAEGEDGSKKKIRMMSANEAFGEFGLIFDTPRSVSVEAITDVVLLVLTRDVYNKHKGDTCLKNLQRWVNATASSIVASGLREIDFLSDVGEKQLNLIGRLFRCEVLPKGTTIIREGETGDRFYILSRGSLVVTTQDDLGLYVELTRLRPGATFGELSLLKDQPRNATITTLEECVLFSLGREEFGYFIKSLPTLGERLERSVNERSTVNVIADKIPVFKSLSKRKQHLLAEVCTMNRHPHGSIILEEGGTTPRKFFIITRGSVDVFVGGNRVRTLNAGDYFGEISLVSDSPHSATVCVSEDDDAYMLECSQEDFRALFVGEPAVLAEISLRVLGTRATLEDVLRHHLGREAFQKHIAKEFATENVDFWAAVEKLENISRRRVRKSVLGALHVQASSITEKKQGMLREQALQIYDEFIADDAPSQVNLPAAMVAQIKAKMDAENYDFKMFSDAKQEVFSLMSKDTFARFQASDLYHDLMARIGVYEQNRPEADA
ncbi:cAMP-dependent protein kinase regulatory subunit [Hondaea fermentalgiana]|uniref:cAMP-dependent protein kinase regulatory subunit n=1 Tax=Hondaea fermentalgiana TaxID=2315210 RepID=A0A2R5GPC7_9STRA|nr:cAMP-dependent protein kinase regulatory subunit [Hondaea fermentalgiana]|eukprot:GBG30181.1 cAMP-dependent protein kinase regulatory subunit [Hondaea fermentalgiana]